MTRPCNTPNTKLQQALDAGDTACSTNQLLAQLLMAAYASGSSVVPGAVWIVQNSTSIFGCIQSCGFSCISAAMTLRLLGSTCGSNCYNTRQHDQHHTLLGVPSAATVCGIKTSLQCYKLGSQ